MLELVGGAIAAKYIRGMNLVRSEIESNTSYYLYNGHGDVVQLSDAAGAVTKGYDYDAFGNEKNSSSSDTNPFRYCGEYLDLETNTYYLRARNYDPTIGRFLSEDTHRGDIKDSLSLNYYTYCYNNPVRYVDWSRNIPVETVIDIASIGWSLTDLINNPSWVNAGYLLWDVGATIVPYAPASYVAKGAKAIGKIDDIADAAKAIGKIDNIADAAKVGTKVASEVASSSALRKNLIAAGKTVPTFDNAAHHIVAGTSKYAADTRAILQKFGIGINDAVNGVFLPTAKGVSNGAYHPGLHTADYYKKVQKMLESAASRDSAIKVLNNIADQLSKGTFIK